MSYDLRLTPAQVLALSEWVEAGRFFADVKLLVNAGGELEAIQGDDYASWTPDGTLLSGGDDEVCAEQQDG